MADWKTIKHESYLADLAKARAEERAKVLSEVDGVISFMLTQPNYGGRTLLELRAKLNQLKGGKC